MKDMDIVHAHTGRAQTLAWTASAGLQHVERIATRHVAFEPRHPLVHRLKYTYLCDGIIAVSQAARRAEVSAGVAGERIETIPTGVEISKLADGVQREAARAHGVWPPTILWSGTWAHLRREKGQDLAIEAFRLLAGGNPQLRMILAGEGPERAEARRFPALRRGCLPGHIEHPADAC